MKNQRVLLPFVIVTLTGVTLLLSARQENAKPTDSLAAVASPQTVPAETPDPPAPPSDPPAKVSKAVKLSYGLDEIAKMIEAGVDPEVVQAFIESSTIAYAPTAEDIVHLRELGAPSPVVAALIRHGGKLRERGIQESRAVQAQLSQPSTPAVACATTVAPQPAAVNYNTFNYAYPTVAYPAYTGCNYIAPRYVCYPRYSYAYPQHCFSRHYFPTYYSSCSPFARYGYYAPRFGVSVGFGSYRFCHTGPRFRASFRF
jgi:hypothetical protein